MLSFGIEYDRAFSTAFCSARLFAGSGPPSRAATMIARDSFEKSCPRFLSAAPFLCLIDDHLLCPDINAWEPLVPPRTPSFLWGNEVPPRPPRWRSGRTARPFHQIRPAQAWAPAGQSPAP